MWVGDLRERDLRVLDRCRRVGEVDGIGIGAGGCRELWSLAGGSIGRALGAGEVVVVRGLGVGPGVGSRVRGSWHSVRWREMLSLFLETLRVEEHLLLSMNKTDRFSELLCSCTQSSKLR